VVESPGYEFFYATLSESRALLEYLMQAQLFIAGGEAAEVIRECHQALQKALRCETVKAGLEHLDAEATQGKIEEEHQQEKHQEEKLQEEKHQEEELQEGSHLNLSDVRRLFAAAEETPTRAKAKTSALELVKKAKLAEPGALSEEEKHSLAYILRVKELAQGNCWTQWGLTELRSHLDGISGDIASEVTSFRYTALAEKLASKLTGDPLDGLGERFGIVDACSGRGKTLLGFVLKAKLQRHVVVRVNCSSKLGNSGQQVYGSMKQISEDFVEKLEQDVLDFVQKRPGFSERHPIITTPGLRLRGDASNASWDGIAKNFVGWAKSFRKDDKPLLLFLDEVPDTGTDASKARLALVLLARDLVRLHPELKQDKVILAGTASRAANALSVSPGGQGVSSGDQSTC
jgi:hypothetical protein